VSGPSTVTTRISPPRVLHRVQQCPHDDERSMSFRSEYYNANTHVDVEATRGGWTEESHSAEDGFAAAIDSTNTQEEELHDDDAIHRSTRADVSKRSLPWR
jgi:hypothetical protein